MRSAHDGTAPPPEEQASEPAQFDEFDQEKAAEAEPVLASNKGMNFWNFVTVSSFEDIALSFQHIFSCQSDRIVQQ
jgi:hypothetical protein